MEPLRYCGQVKIKNQSANNNKQQIIPINPIRLAL